jgi:hypothetical protein
VTLLRRVLVVLVLAASALVAGTARPAWACSCAQVDALEAAELAFTGVATSVDRPWTPGDVEVTFAVESVRKGAAGERVELVTHSDEPTCGYGFTEGHRYEVFATGGRTGLCDGNVDLGAAPPAQRVTGRWTTVAVLAVLAAAGAVLIRRRRRGTQ